MYRRAFALIVTSILLLSGVAASSPYIIDDGNTLSVTLLVDQIEFVDVAFIGDDQLVMASDSNSENAIPVLGTDSLVRLASSLRSKCQLEL